MEATISETEKYKKKKGTILLVLRAVREGRACRDLGLEISDEEDNNLLGK